MQEFDCHDLLRKKGVMHLTASGYLRYKLSLGSIHSFISFVIRNDKQTASGTDGSPKNQTAQGAVKV